MAWDWLVPAATTAIGFGASLFGGKKKQDDPLAGIRQQLMSIASGIPSQVSAMKEQIGKEYGAARTEGTKGIQEDIHATRGLGKTTLEDRLQTELLDQLARGQASAELGAERWGTGAQISALQGAAGVPFPEEQAGWQEQLLGLGGQMFGQQLGYNGLEGLMKPQNAGIDVSKWAEEIPTAIHSFGGRL